MQIRYRGHSLDVEIIPDRLKANARRCTAEPIKIGLKEKVFELRECRVEENSLEE